jgi:hypothetical protein
MHQSIKNGRRKSFRPTPELLEGRQLLAATDAFNVQLQAGADGLQQALADDSVGFDSINYTYQDIGTPTDVQALQEQGNSVAAAAGGNYWTQAWSDEAVTRSLVESAYQTWLNGFTTYGSNNDTGGPWYQIMQQAQNEAGLAGIAAYQADQLIANDIADPTWTPTVAAPSPAPTTPEVYGPPAPNFTLKPGVVLPEDIASKVVEVADAYHAATGKKLTITDGVRGVAEQASAIYKKIVADGATAVKTLYANKTLIQEIIDAYNSAKTKADRISAMTTTIQNQVDQGQYISKHLIGDAVDIQSRGLTAKQKTALRNAAENAGGKLVNETGSAAGPHYHLQF